MLGPRIFVLIGVVVLLHLGAAFSTAHQLGDARAALAPAAGVSLTEVVSVEEIDSRPSDGDLYVEVVLETLRKSGTVLESLQIVKEHGGMRPPGPPPPADPLSPVPFEKGKRYWFVWSSRHEWSKYPHRLVVGGRRRGRAWRR